MDGLPTLPRSLGLVLVFVLSGCSTVDGGFRTQGRDRLQDTSSGLVWTRSDNGTDLDWHQAKRYCEAKGSGWQLPTVAELKGLHDPASKHAFAWTLPGTDDSYQIKPRSGLLRLGACCYWSSQLKDEDEAWYVDLDDGDDDEGGLTDPAVTRVLCVKRE